jgi:hypothetical protein
MNRRFSAGITLGDYIREYSMDLTSNSRALGSRDKAAAAGEQKEKMSCKELSENFKHH